MNKSEKYTLNWRDAGRALIMAVLGAAVVTAQQLLSTGAEWNKDSLKVILTASLGAGVAYIAKNFFSNKQGKFLGSKVEGQSDFTATKKAFYPRTINCTGINGTAITPESWENFVANRSSLYSWQTDADGLPYIERTFPSEEIAIGSTLQELYSGNTINVASTIQGDSFWLGPKPHRPF